MITSLMLGTAISSSALVSTLDTLDIFEDGSCIALYKLDGDTTDVSDNYNGVASNITYSDGKFGQAAVFNGINSDIELGLLPISNDFTLSLFAKASSLSGLQRIVYLNDGTDTDYTWVSLSDTDIVTRLTTTSTKKASMADFVHIVLSFSDGVQELYIDSDFDNSSSLPAFSKNLNVLLGFDGAGYRFNGLIDHLRIFNRALTAQEVVALYNEGV